MIQGLVPAKVLYGHIRKELGKVLAELARHKESCIEVGSLHPDHVHSVAQVIGYIKGKSAIHIARTYAGKKRNFTGEQFWARGYFVSTVGKDDRKIKEYVSHQQAEDKRMRML